MLLNIIRNNMNIQKHQKNNIRNSVYELTITKNNDILK